VELQLKASLSVYQKSFDSRKVLKSKYALKSLFAIVTHTQRIM